MTLLFHDSCDLYASNDDILSRWDSANTSGDNWQFVPNGGVKGGGALRCQVDDIGLRKRIRPVGGSEKLTRVAFWFKSTDKLNDTILFFEDSALARFNHLTTNTTGRLQLSRSGSSTTFGVIIGATDVCDGNWHFIEITLKTSSPYERTIKVDGVVDATSDVITGIATTTLLNHCDRLIFTAPDMNGADFDDIIVWDDNPGGLTGTLSSGAPYFAVSNVNGAGSSSDFTANNAPTNHEAVDDLNINDADTTYVESGTAGHKDLYQTTDLPAAVQNIIAVTTVAFVRTEAASEASMKLKLLSSTSEVDSADFLINGDEYKPIFNQWDVDPNTGAAWTVAGLNAAEIGMEIV